MTFKQYQHHKKVLGINAMPPEEVVLKLVNRLIEALYIPTPKGITIDPIRLKLFQIENEPFNSANLTCSDVFKKDDNTFLVIIDEAAPDGCPTLCRYISEFAKYYGWNVIVKTEW